MYFQSTALIISGITPARYRCAVKMRQDNPCECRGSNNMNIQPWVHAPLNSTSLNIDPVVHDVNVGSLSEDVMINTCTDEAIKEEIESVSAPSNTCPMK